MSKQEKIVFLKMFDWTISNDGTKCVWPDELNGNLLIHNYITFHPYSSGLDIDGAYQLQCSLIN